MRTLTARTTGVNRGQRFFRTQTFERVKQIELDFIAASGDRPAQARIWHEVWDRQLQRYDVHVRLICQDPDLDVDGLALVGRAAHIAPVEPDLLSVSETVYDRADEWWKRQAEEALRRAAESGVEFTTDELRDLGAPDLDNQREQAAYWGSLTARARREGRIREVGRRPSLRPSANGRKVIVWIGAVA